MKFRYTLEETASNGAIDRSLRDFDKDEVIVGRGSACDIRLDSRFVSLNHARFFLVGSQLAVEDLNSLSGLTVNGKVGTRSDLQVGDEVKLADVVLKVTFEGGVWGVLQTKTVSQNDDLDTKVERDVENLALSKRLPGFTALSIVAVLAVFGYFLILPMSGVNKEVWSSGPISNNHAMIADKCAFCHATPFVKVQDAECMHCHNMTDHAAAFNKVHQAHMKPELGIRCAECHMEHNGDSGLGGRGIIAAESQLCTDCHSNIKAVYPDAKTPDVPSFDLHPQFQVQIQPQIPGGPYTRVSLDDAANLRDNSYIKLNHEKHLSELKTAKGRVRLSCNDCHKIADDWSSIEPISYEKHCQECHSLEFDERLAGKHVPHGASDVVYKFLYAEYAKLMLSSEEDRSIQQNFDVRAIPGGGVSGNSSQARDQFVRSFVERESRSAEQTLFTKTACYLCHKVLEKEIDVRQATAEQVSRYEVVTPQIPDKWMPQSIFSHGAHEEVKCEECHEQAPRSAKTNDVLLPRIQSCFPCHSQSGQSPHAEVGQGKVKSDCIMCHSYHDSLPLPQTKKRSTAEVISSLN